MITSKIRNPSSGKLIPAKGSQLHALDSSSLNGNRACYNMYFVFQSKCYRTYIYTLHSAVELVNNFVFYSVSEDVQTKRKMLIDLHEQ